MATRAMALLCLLFLLFHGGAGISTGTPDGQERWGYVKTRPKVNIFWWWYKSPQTVSSQAKPWPTVVWLQGGPGGSGVGRGNFQEIGPLDVDLKPRSLTWLNKAHLIFLDNPVGAGYSYAEDQSALVTTDEQAVADIMEVLKALTKELPTLQTSPLFVVGESYGGKHAAMVGVALARAIHAGTLKLTLGGVALGDSWISPDDFTTWTDLLDFIDSQSDSVNMDNFLLDTGMNPVLADDVEASSPSLRSTRLMYVGHQASDSPPNKITSIMNGVIKQKLKIIPKEVMWQEASIDAYNALASSFMKPAINEVDQLLSYDINVTVYNGQLDVICSVIGTEAWVRKLKWTGLNNFLSQRRQPQHYCDSAMSCSKPIKAYVRAYKNMQFYWVLEAGHMVPVDQPYVAFRIISSITQSPGA